MQGATRGPDPASRPRFKSYPARIDGDAGGARLDRTPRHNREPGAAAGAFCAKQRKKAKTAGIELLVKIPPISSANATPCRPSWVRPPDRLLVSSAVADRNSVPVIKRSSITSTSQVSEPSLSVMATLFAIVSAGGAFCWTSGSRPLSAAVALSNLRARTAAEAGALFWA